jgi:glucosamine--fructose-6-phosphate aminotransferase (isomerizing)
MVEKEDFAEAVAAQPENLERTRLCVAAALSELRLPQWLPGQTVAVVSMGASSHSANALVAALVASGLRGMNITASDFALYPAGYQVADHYVLVSESGRSPEPIAAAGKMTVGRRIGITNVPASPLSGVTDFLLPLGGFVDSGVYTIGYTATLLAYALLLEAVGVPGWATDVDAIPGLVREALGAHGVTARAAARGLEHVSAIDFVGRGFSAAAAAEGALVFREATRRPTAAFETYQYLHGPMEGAGERTALVVFGDGRELTLIDSVLGTGAKVILITTADHAKLANPEHEDLTVIELPRELKGFARAIVEMVVVKLCAGALADLDGIPIGNFVYRQSDTKLAIN